MDANQDDNNWTVIGVWLGDSPVPVGVIRGTHDVEGGDESEFPDGLWTTTVQASNAADAESAAVAEMSGDDEDDSEVQEILNRSVQDLNRS